MNLKVISIEAFSVQITVTLQMNIGTSGKFNDMLTSALVKHENEAQNMG